jgi:glycogen operon protein
MTQHASSGVPDAERGTFRGLCSKIPELKKLGVNVVELLPIFDFDENENRNTHPATGDRLYNYWGYSPLLWFAPKASYASVPARATQEFQEFVQACHAAGLEVWLDVVYNHTAELDDTGPIDHFKALSPHETYLHTPDGHLRNDSGCGNTLRCRHPLTREWVIESLRYWHHELGIDGFRFDLTTILNRDPQSGEVADFPTLLWELREDPTFAAAKWIAEPWDAAGGYQLGHYAFHADWLEWNDRYRDEMRRVLCGMPNQAQAFQRCIEGSPHIYGDRAAGAQNSLNFLTAHDGFTLMDLFSYREKHNAANGEGNRDGHPENFSDNGGVEGPTADPQVLAWREQKWRLAFALLAVSNGPMMFVSGDEWGRSQQGNNNAYCQDNELNWLRWDEAEQSSRRVDYVQQLLQLRNKCRSLWWSPQTKVDWFSSAGGEADWGPHVRSFVWRLRPPDPDEPPFWFCCNAFDAALPFQLPVASLDGLWHSSEFLHVDWPAPTEQTWLIPAWTLWIGRESHPTANTP